MYDVGVSVVYVVPDSGEKVRNGRPQGAVVSAPSIGDGKKVI